MNNTINQALIDKIQLSYSNTPLAVFLIGANGSGKSTLRNYLNLTDIQTNIDPDVLNRIFKVKYTNTFQIESARLALSMYSLAMKSSLNICMESTLLSGNGTMQRIINAKQNGYFLIGYFIGLNDVKINLDRIRKRVASGGHNIEEKTVYKRYHESITNLLQVKNYFDNLHVIDNSYTHYKLQLSCYGSKTINYNNDFEPWVDAIANKF